MSFIYSIIVGAIFGFIKVPFIIGIISILVIVSFRSIKDIIFKKDFFTGVQSQYQLYLLNLDKLNKSRDKVALKYFAQSLLIDGFISIVVFIIVRQIN